MGLLEANAALSQPFDQAAALRRRMMAMCSS